jgi:exopolyphosphatase/guanosine-5'-triphosphate,3'-diphosphate pyrophosphatase
MKVAVLDLGTNTFHLLIVDVKQDGSFSKIFKSKMAVMLGKDGIHHNRIAPPAFDRGIKALKHYSDVIRRLKPEKVFAFATSAIRSASNGRKFVEQVFRETGIRIKVITGSREASLICRGVRQSVLMTEKPQLIMDIGGGSTEFIIANGNKIFWKKSFNIGVSRLLETFRPGDPITANEVRAVKFFLEKTLAPLDAAVKKFPVHSLIGSSGSFDTLAEMIGWRFYKRDILKNVKSLRFNLEDYAKLHKMLLSSTTAQRMRMKGLVKMRVDLIVLSSICTGFVLGRYSMLEMILSKTALKEGALWQVSKELFHSTGKNQAMPRPKEKP